MTTIESLLKTVANEHAAELCELGDTVSDKSLKKGSAYQSMELDGENAYRVIRAAAIESGTVIQDNEDKGVLAVLLKGGIAKMAPVLLVASIKGDRVDLGCYSKEGLILQHAAEKTLAAFLKAVD